MNQQTDDGAEKPTMRGSEELLAEGKRCLAAGDVASAVESFQSACSLMGDQYGQLSKELAEPYYLYGKALLECARMESTVLGSGIPVPEDRASSDEEGEGDEEEEEEGEEGGGGEADSTPTDVPSEQANDPQASAATTGVSSTSACEGEKGKVGEVEEPSGSGGAGPSRESEKMEEGEGGGGEEEEEETDLKLAWEVLELARVICQKEESDEFKLKLSDVYFALGEVALESDQTDQAVGDMNSGLQLKELLLEPHDRRLAEAHFNLGLAYGLQKDTKRSIQEYKCARNTLSLRKEKLVGEMEGKEEGERKQLEEELVDLDSLLPDLDAKISDACAEEKEAEEETTSFGFSGSASTEDATKTDSASKAPISDISHLVRKRPAPAAVDGDSTEGKDPKRIRIEEPSTSIETPNDTAATNGTSSVPELTSEQ